MSAFVKSGMARFEPTGQIFTFIALSQRRFSVVLNGIAVILGHCRNPEVTMLPLIRLESSEIFLFTGGTENGCQVSR